MSTSQWHTLPATDMPMKEYRFVRFLGEEIAAVGTDIARVIEEVGATKTVSDIPDEWATAETVAARIQRDFPKRVSERVGGQTKGGVEFIVRTIEAGGSNTSNRDASFGIVFDVQLPEYRLSKGTLLTPVALASRTSQSVSASVGLKDTVRRLLTWTADAYVLAAPVENGVSVIPAQAIAATRADGVGSSPVLEGLYAKGLERFVQDLARCFIGDPSIVPTIPDEATWEDRESQYRETMRTLEVGSMLYIRVQEGVRDARLNEF